MGDLGFPILDSLKVMKVASWIPLDRVAVHLAKLMLGESLEACHLDEPKPARLQLLHLAILPFILKLGFIPLLYR